MATVGLNCHRRRGARTRACSVHTRVNARRPPREVDTRKPAQAVSFRKPTNKSRKAAITRTLPPVPPRSYPASWRNSLS